MFARAAGTAFVVALLFELFDAWAEASIPGYADDLSSSVLLFAVPLPVMFVVGYRIGAYETWGPIGESDRTLSRTWAVRVRLASIAVGGVVGYGVGQLLAISAGLREALSTTDLGLVSLLGGLITLMGAVTGLGLAVTVDDRSVSHPRLQFLSAST